MNPERPPDADALADHAAFVRAVARAVLKGDDAVDDVVQDTYAAALESGPSKPGALRAWLAGVARRQAAGRIRRRAMHRRHAPHLPHRERDEATLDVAARVETGRQVVDAVMSLDEPYRSAILMRYWDDLAPREIAKRKEVPVETVRTWVKRGLGQLRARLERDHGSGRDGWKAVLLPLVFVPEASTAVAATATIGGVLAMKKAASFALVLLVLAGGVLWWNRGNDAVEREGADSKSAPVGEAPLEAPSAAAPTLTGRTEATAAEPVDVDLEGAPYHGRVLAPDGAPMAGVRVTAPVWFCKTAEGMWSIYHAAGSPQDLLPTTTTDAQGCFAFAAAPDGKAQDPDRPIVAIDVHVLAEGYLPAEARIERDEAVDVRLHRGGTLAVCVVDLHGEVVARAGVKVIPTTHLGPASLQGIPSRLRRIVTDADGRGETNLPAGTYRLRAHASGHAPGTADEVGVEEGRRIEHQVHLGEGLVIDVRVVGPEEELVADALVHLGGPLGSSGRAKTDAEGRCRIPGIAPPARPDDYWKSMVYYQVKAKGYALRFGYRRLPRDRKTFELELPLVRGVPVRLHVVDDAGAPLAGVEASLALDANAANPLPSTIDFTTDASGWVELSRLAPRPYSVTLVNREGGYQTERIDLVVGTEAVEREVVLERRRASLAGTVLLPDGSAATGGSIGVAPLEADRAHRLTTVGRDVTADGTFTLTNLKSGPQVLVASVPGFLPQWQEIEVAPGETREGIVFRLEPRGLIRGQVLGWGEVAIAEAAVHLEVRRVTRVGTREAHSMVQVPLGKTDAEGWFEVRGLDDEPVEFLIQREGWVRAWPWPEALRAGAQDAVFVMKPAGEGTGMPLIARVLADGQPYDGKLSVAVMDPGGGNLMGMIPPVSKGEGLYECRIHLRKPGLYDLRFTARGWRPFEVNGVEIRHRPPRPEVSVALNRGAVLELRVVDGEGRPWANRWLQYWMGQIQTDARGIVELAGLEPGTLESLRLGDPTDGRYTYAHFESVPVPGTLEVVMRRCGHVKVTTPFLYSTVEHDLVFQVLDAEGTVVDVHMHPVGRYGELERTALGFLKIYADGTYRVVLETNGKRVETEVDAQVGRAVEVTLDPR